MRADDVRAKDLAVFRVADDLDESFCLAGRARTPVRRKGEFTDLVFELLLLALLLRQTDGRDLRVTIRRIRDVAVIHSMRMLPGEILGEDDAFALAFVGEHRRACDVADSEDALRGGLHVIVDLDESAIGELDPGFLE